jgi:hypothetical protein
VQSPTAFVSEMGKRRFQRDFVTETELDARTWRLRREDGLWADHFLQVILSQAIT